MNETFFILERSVQGTIYPIKCKIDILNSYLILFLTNVITNNNNSNYRFLLGA